MPSVGEAVSRGEIALLLGFLPLAATLGLRIGVHIHDSSLLRVAILRLKGQMLEGAAFQLRSVLRWDVLKFYSPFWLGRDLPSVSGRRRPKRRIFLKRVDLCMPSSRAAASRFHSFLCKASRITLP